MRYAILLLIVLAATYVSAFFIFILNYYMR
jgi:hypothetical protein